MKKRLFTTIIITLSIVFIPLTMGILIKTNLDNTIPLYLEGCFYLFVLGFIGAFVFVSSKLIKALIIWIKTGHF